MRIMGLDFGSRTVGVAISDSLLLTAQGVEIIRRKEENKLRQTFWFRHDKDKGKVLQVWYNPNARCVERKSWETEFFAAVLAVIGSALLLIR